MATVNSPGCVIFLIDESAAMGAATGGVVSDGKTSTKTNAERVATALNALLNQLSKGPDFEMALIGYQTDAAGQASIGSRWGGALAGREFVTVGELAAAPLRVETRTRKIPAPGGLGPPREEAMQFPVWYAATLGTKAPQIAAFDYCRDLLSRWSATAGPSPGTPLIIHVLAGASGDGNPQQAIDKLLNLPSPADPPLVFQAHVASSADAVSALYPSSHVYLTMGSARDLFRRASPLPSHLMDALRQAKVVAHNGAHGMLYNARIADIIRLFSLVPAHTKDWPAKALPGAEMSQMPAIAVEALSPLGDMAAGVAPPAMNGDYPLAADSLPMGSAVGLADPAAEMAGLSLEPAAAPACTEKAALVVFVLDRSLEDPFSGNMQNPCAKLQEQANDLLRQIANLKEGAAEAAMVSYGLDSGGQSETRATFDGPLSGRATVAHADLMAGALRVDEAEEEIPNGLGGVIKVTRKKPVFFDVEPTAAAPPQEAFAAAARIAGDWCALHPDACLPPIVLYLTRGRAEPSELEQAAAPLHAIVTAAGPAVLYALVVTESPVKTVVYPDSDALLEDPTLKKLWDLSSPLLGRARLAADRPIVKAESRGLVINGNCDLLLDEVKRLLAN